ncbi:MAG: Rrf2 family transcriptional regulator [Actinomycetota bacterium]
MRLELNKRTDLALRAMQTLCSSPDRLPGTELAETLDTTHQYLPQIMAPLVRNRWVTSTPGPRGGYELTAQLDTISVLELIEAMEGPTDIETCVLSGETCGSENPCALHGAWSQARDALLHELSSVSLDDAWGAC